MTLPWEDYDKTINKYKVKVGSTLEVLTKKILDSIKTHTVGLSGINYYSGRRIDDDLRQIKRWLSLAGPQGRFRLNLINQIKRKKDSGTTYQLVQKLGKLFSTGAIG